jgi:alkyldihydroxyacetonephosphate synthase
MRVFAVPGRLHAFVTEKTHARQAERFTRTSQAHVTPRPPAYYPRVDDALASLSERLPDGAISTDPDDLRSRSRDWWTLGMLREVRGDPVALPLAVVFPGTTEEVAVVMAWADETRTPVVARGGGSSVTGAAQPNAGAIVLDLTRMNAILDVDSESQTVTVQAGANGADLEAELNAGHHLTLGHYPQSIAISTVGGWIAASSAGQASAGYGAIEDRLLGLTAVLAGGQVVSLRTVPRSASGPDLRRLLVGSEGAFAVVTEATLACAPMPPGYTWESLMFDTFDGCMHGLRDALRTDAHPLIVRGYDETDAALNLGAAGHAGGCAAIVGFASDAPGLGERRRAVRDAATANGGRGVEAGYGEHWLQHRNDAVATYLRIMGPERSFGPGVAVDTIEVAGVWRGLPQLYTRVRAGLLEHADVVGCHLSHVYPSGSSLYFTFLIRAQDDRAAEPRYLAAWDGGVRAALAEGGTMSHHHGVGRIRAPYLADELGPGGTEMLRRVKAGLDPNGILNPGVPLP